MCGAPVSPGGPQRADARRNRDSIVEAARKVFAEYGDRAQMDDIAREACLGVGTLYRHFATKDALVGEIMRRKFVEIAERAERYRDVEDPWEAFAGFVTENVESMAEDATQQRVMWDAGQEAFTVAGRALGEMRTAVGELIARAHEAGELRRDFTVDDMPTLMSALGSTMTRRAGPRRNWRKLLTIALDGLRAERA